MKRIKLLTLLLLALLIVGCSSWGSWYVEDGLLRDHLYSVELRRSGTVYAWMIHDETGVYCIEPDVATQDQLERWLRDATPVIVRYKESRLVQGSPCWGGEANVEGSGFEVFLVTAIAPAP